MEFVVVLYPRMRDVFIDGNRVGPTNHVLYVARGQHLFHLGAPVDYKPKMQTANIVDTNIMKPALVSFA